MSDILQALPVPAAMAVTAALALWKKLVDTQKECREERLAADARERELIKELASLTQRLLLAHEKLRLGSESPSSQRRSS